MNLEPTRRDVLSTGVSAAIALAVTPADGWAASTDDAGLVAETVSIPSGDARLPGYVARPQGKGPFPLVLVVHEIFGVHAWIQDVCRRLAREGYVAVAPYLFTRQGDVTKLDSVDRIVAEVVSKVDPADALRDLDATRAWAVRHAHADADRVAITGFCWGGTIVWAYAATHPDIEAGAAWYGRLVAAPGSTATMPLDLAPALKVPVLGLYGGKDASIPAEHVDQMRSALAQGPSGSEIVVYPEAGHGFLADYRPGHDAAASQDAWPKMLAWFRAHGA